MARPSIETVIGLIYESSLAGDWGPALRALEAALHRSNAVVMQHDPAARIYLPHGLSDQALALRYVQHYAPMNHAWPVLMRQSPGLAFTDGMLLDLDAHRRSVYFNEFLQPNGMASLAGGVLSRTATLRAGLSIGHGVEDGFDDALVVRLGRVLPHFARALRLRHRLDGAGRATAAHWTLAGHRGSGLMLADARAQVLRLNAAAEAMLAAGDGLALSRGRLAAASAGDTTLLRTMIAARSNPVGETRAAASDLVRIGRPSGRAPFVVDVLTWPGAPTWAEAQAASVAVFVRELDAVPRTADRVLREMFGLTRAECRLSLLIGNGEGLAGIANRLGVSVPTVRTHLARALNKTGLHRQSELARLVARCAP